MTLRIGLIIAFLAAVVAPASAQKAEIEAVNARWVAFFNQGNFDGIASLYAADAIAFPPGSPMVKGRTAIGAMWKSMAEHVGDPKVTTIDVRRPLGGTRNRHIQFKNQGLDAEGSHRQISRGVAEGW